MMIERHPMRDLVWRELHARPYVRFTHPAHVFHFAFLIPEQDVRAGQAAMDRLIGAYHLEPTYQTPRHSIFAATVGGLGRVVTSWERHIETLVCTLFIYELQIPFEPFGIDAGRIFPEGFFAGFGAAPLVATYLCAADQQNLPPGRDLFDGHTVNASKVMAGRAEARSAYRMFADGFNRVALIVHDMTEAELGRTAQRLFVIEDSYHQTLLALPLAREVRSDLAGWENRMMALMQAMRSAATPEEKRAVLDALLSLAAEVEDLRTRATGRFAASAAYYSICEEQLRELRERKIEHVFRLSTFLLRRLSPAARTCRSVLERMATLSDHIDGATDLLRTGIELDIELQNQRLLASVDRRARLQLQLQHAVEGLSVIIFTYYTLEILARLLGAADVLGWHMRPAVIVGVAVIPIFVIYAVIVWRIGRKFHDR
jgi:uncharacterized membrane-anchored protein